jgi:aromatic ring-cleaving dioxygenase
VQASRPPGAKDVGGSKAQMTDSKVQAARKAIGRRHAVTRGGKQLRRVGPHFVSLAACLFTYVKGLR